MSRWLRNPRPGTSRRSRSRSWRAYIGELETEIGRARQMITAKRSIRGGADALFQALDRPATAQIEQPADRAEQQHDDGPADSGAERAARAGRPAGTEPLRGDSSTWTSGSPKPSPQPPASP